MSARLTGLVVTAMLTAASTARAQQVVPLSGGWSLHRRIGVVTGLQTVACARDVAYARSWSGDIARWDGTSWQAVPRRPGDFMYGRTLAVSPDGRVFMEARGKIARWDGSTWTDFTLPTWQGDVGGGIVATSANDVYYVGRGRIAHFDGAAFATYGAGTWRDLTALAITDRDILAGGQGGTIQRYDGRAWARETTGTDAWIRGMTAFTTRDTWAWADGPTYRTSIVIHYDGRSWARRDTGLAGAVTGLGGSATGVYATGDFGVQKWSGGAWTMELAAAAVGQGYHSFVGVCATARHVIVGDTSGDALVRAL